MTKINPNNIIIQGYMDGEPIWREKTPGEKLEERLKDTKLFKHDYTNARHRGTLQ